MKVYSAQLYFGNQQKIADHLGVNKSAISRWQGEVPELQARRLQAITNGELVFDPEEYPDAPENLQINQRDCS